MEAKAYIDIINELMNKIHKEFADLHHLNIVVAGKSGVGKSTLINAVFRKELAKTGVGTPIIPGIEKITCPDFPLTIYDSCGFEDNVENQKTVLHALKELINKGKCSNNVDDQIHCIWYCINTMSSRLEPEELTWINELASEGVPVILVLTQSFFKAAEQVTMIAKITNVFGVELSKAAITTITASLLGTQGATVVGKTVVKHLLKLIPGAGTIVGGAISGGTAASITKGLGEMYIKLMVAVYKGEIKVSDLEKNNAGETIKTIIESKSENEETC